MNEYAWVRLSPSTLASGLDIDDEDGGGDEIASLAFSLLVSGPPSMLDTPLTNAGR